MALVHITHYNSEAETADRTVNLSDSADNMVMVDKPLPGGHRDAGHPPPPAASRRSQLVGVGHVYADGTPWAKTALSDISFTINAGRRGSDPRRQRLRQVDAGLDHGGADRPTAG